MLQAVTDSLRSLPQAAVESVCGDFYDGELLSPAAGLTDRQRFADRLLAAVGRADLTFEPFVDADTFRLEVTALRFEVFGLLVDRRLGWRNERACLKELLLTQRYLTDRDEARVWGAM